MLRIDYFDVNDRRVIVKTRDNFKMEGYASMPQGGIITIYNQPNKVTEFSHQLKLPDGQVDLKVGQKCARVK